MIIRLAERHLKTKFGNYLEILYYDGQSESIALVMEMSKRSKMFFVEFIQAVFPLTSLTVSSASAERKWKRRRL